MTLMLEAQVREGNPEAIREEGLVPAVMYGPKSEPQHIAIAKMPFKKAFAEAGESTVVTLDVAGTKTDALINDVQFHPVTNEPIHADFYIFDKNATVEVEIPLEFTGESPAVKNLGGILVKVAHEITVEALPKDLPHEIIVDISSLIDFDSQIKASDLKLPQGVTLVTEEDQDEVIAMVDTPREETEEEAAPVDLSSVEIEKKGKKEEETSAE